MAAALQVPETRRKIESNGQIVVGNTPREFAEQVAKFADVAEKIVKAIGFKPD